MTANKRKMGFEIVQKLKGLVGERLIKTALAVFVTAFICDLLDWPPMFAVITAIVTIEPTAANSIKKAFVRFPATAIGAAFSMFFTFSFGETPLTYAIVAFATIAVCYHLKLYDGILVATLTSVAMVSTVDEQYLTSFFIRLGTTGIGLLISTIVNLFVLRPNYTTVISEKLMDLKVQIAALLFSRIAEIIENDSSQKQTIKKYQLVMQELATIETLCEYQKEEWKLHKFHRNEIKLYRTEFKKLYLYRQIMSHVSNLMSLEPKFSLNNEKIELIKMVAMHAQNVLAQDSGQKSQEHAELGKHLVDVFWSLQQEQQKVSQFSQETVLFYELISIHNVLKELQTLNDDEKESERRLLVKNTL